MKDLQSCVDKAQEKKAKKKKKKTGEASHMNVMILSTSSFHVLMFH